MVLANGLPRRAAILEREGLSAATPQAQEEFWRRYNFTPWRRRLPAALGDVVQRVWPETAGKKSGLAERLAAAWQRVLPAEYAESAKVDGYTGGRLKVLVDNAATRFVLERQLGDVLIAAVNQEVGSQAVQRIDYRVGNVSGRRRSIDGKKKTTRERKA